MRSEYTPALLLLLLPACAAAVRAPEIPPSWPPERAEQPLSRADCVELATRWAPNAAAWEARRAAAHAALDAAGRLPNPHVELALEELPLGRASDVPVQITASLFVALQDLFARGSRQAAAGAELAAEEALLRAELADLARDVRGAYDGLLAARRRVALAAERERVLGSARTAVAEFVASGDAPGIELERAEARLFEASAARSALEDEARAAEIEFAFSLGFERPVRLQLSDALQGEYAGAAGAARPAEPAADLEALLAEAANARPEIAAAQARYDAERERLQLAADRVRFLPSVGAGPRFESGDVRGVATLDVELPLFDAGGPAVTAQEAGLLGAAAELRRVTHQAAAEVCSAAAQAAAADQRARAACALAERRSALAAQEEQLFQAGESGYLELVQARLDELAARGDLQEAELVQAAERLALDHALGRLAALP